MRNIHSHTPAHRQTAILRFFGFYMEPFLTQLYGSDAVHCGNVQFTLWIQSTYPIDLYILDYAGHIITFFMEIKACEICSHEVSDSLIAPDHNDQNDLYVIQLHDSVRTVTKSAQ